MSLSRNSLRLVALAGVCASALTFACDDTEDADERPSLGLYAFPSSVAPNAETTIAVVVRGACASDKSCKLKVGLTPATTNADPGVLFQPGLSAAPGPLLDIALDANTSASDQEPLSLVYRAPSAEGARVVAASLFDAAGKIVATRTISVNVAKPTAAVDSGASSSGAASDGGKDGATDTGALDATPDAIVDAGGQ